LSEQLALDNPPARAQVKQPSAARQYLDRTFKYWAILPTMLILVVFTLYPVFQLLRMSVSDIQFVEAKLQWTFVGTKWVQTALRDPVVPDAFRNTLVFVFVVVVVESILGLVLAFAVSRANRMAPFYRAVLLIPLLIPPIAIGTIWRMMYDYNFGVINRILGTFGIVGPTWLADPNLAFPAIWVVDFWHWTSFLFLIMLAGVESLPQDLFEAGRVDGASELQVYRYIMLPLMRPTIIVAMMLRTIFAFKVFDQIYLLTNGGPGTTTEVISLYIYKVFFGQFRMGYGAFLALLLALLISVFVTAYRIINARLSEEALQ
jgi:multiple sugar transport system permease protein